MKLEIQSLVSESASANPYLNADGFLNIKKVKELQKEVMKEHKALLKENPKLKPIEVAVKSVKKNGVDYSAKMEKAKNPTYLRKRAVKVAIRPSESRSEVIGTLLANYEGLSKGLAKKVTQAFSAIRSHEKKAPVALQKVAKIAEKARDAKAKAFDAVADEVIEMLGVKESSIVRASGMGGQSLVVKLPSGGFISITGADAARFKAAKAAAAE